MSEEVLTQVWELLLRPLLTIVPLALFLVLFQRVVLRTPVSNLAQLSVGVGMSAVGLVLFSLGLRLGLSPLGDMVGRDMGADADLLIVVLFSIVLGYGATVAEPALAAMGMQVENVTAGAFKKQLLVHAVAVGVAAGVTAGMLIVAYDVPLLVILLPAAALLAGLAAVTPPRYLAIAWDSGGVTTGPVTVPLVLSLGLGIAAGEGGFGIITLASLGPILSVSVLGLLLNASSGARYGGRVRP